MSKTFDYIVKKYKVNLEQKSPINIPEALRENFAQTLGELGFKIGVEVGTWDGEHAQILCENIPDLKLYCVDPWERYSRFRDYHTYTFQPAYEKAVERLKPHNVTFMRRYSMDAVKDFADKSLDFVYIDANHDFRHVTEDLDSWSKKVRRGGVIFGHDYHKTKNRWDTQQVYYAVGAYFYANRIKPWFTLGVENLVLDKGNGVRAWLWIK